MTTPYIPTAIARGALLVAALGMLNVANVAEGQFRRGPSIASPMVSAEREVTFRVSAPNAEEVRLTGSDFGNLGDAGAMTKNDEGVWETTLAAVEPGAYRYRFVLDGVQVTDPANTSMSESNNNVWSLVHVEGEEFMDQRNVPHGAVAEVHYFSKSLEANRRMHVYTPPGYEAGTDTYPVFYLLHGAGDCDDSWSTVGRAGFILDNLIAEGKAKPMVVVMPAGHTPQAEGGGRGRGGQQSNAFANDFLNDIKPLVESRYRVHTDRANRAIAGLSMGGAQTLDIAIPHLEDFSHFGVYSSGVFSLNRAGRGGRGRRGGGNAQEPAGPSWEERNAEKLDDATLKEGLKLVWFATGTEDFLLETSRASVELLRKHDFEVIYEETGGGHTWANWRDYLHEFVPLLFQDQATSTASESTQPASSHDDSIDDAQGGFASIFDGETLDGWKGDPVYWRVEDGCLVGEITPNTVVDRNTFIIWQGGQPADFELKLEYRISSRGNSGINYRSLVMDDHPYALTGYQADIDGQNRYTGQNYEERGRTTLAFRGQKTVLPPLDAPPGPGGLRQFVERNAWTKAVVKEEIGDRDELASHVKDEDWNTYHIIARGNHLQHFVNGVLMSDVTDDDKINGRASGHIGVQVHVGPPMKVEYRKILLKELK
jgi:enterochelin esterase family protein